MSTEPQSAALAAQIAAAEASPGAFRAFLAWALQRQAKYEAERRAWRRQNPIIDVKALEAEYGIEPDILTVEQLKANAPKLMMPTKSKPPPPEGTL